MVDEKDTKKTTGKKTLGVGGTLTLSSKPASNVKRQGHGVAVEVKKRRFATPHQTGANVSSADTEMNRRLQVLEQARKNSAEEEKRREEERRQAQELAKSQAQKQEEQRKAKEEASRRLVEESQRVEKESQTPEIKPEDAPLPIKPQPRSEPNRPAFNDVNDSRKASVKPSKDSVGKRKGGRNAYLEELEQRYRSPSMRRKKGKRNQFVAESAEKVYREVTIPETITVQELAKRMTESIGDVVKRLMLMGQMVTQNQPVDQETAALIVEEFGHTYKFISDSDVEEGLVSEDSSEELIERPPVVTVMGHVDHGKTSLLDALRKTDVAEGEAGGITQHIGAYQIETENGRKITFLDTPGHEAFTSMRSRGASITDVVILVVAADDGVMPQTIEAIRHAKAAEVPIVVAVNKCDKPEADPSRVKQELLNHDLIPEEYGGDVVCVDVSAKTGKGLDTLEEMVLLQADVLELTANPNRRADGTVVESRLDKGRGPVVTVIVQGGTLKVGDVLVCGSVYGRVRALTDDRGRNIDEAPPSFPVEIQGLEKVCDAGDNLIVTEDDRKAREVASFRDRRRRELEQVAANKNKMSLDNLFNRISEGTIAKVCVVVKGDVQGSVEAITESLEKLATEEVKVQVIHSAVGVITENDVNLASASDAVVIGFNVRANVQARGVAERDGIEIRYYNVIYNLVDDMKAAMTGMLTPDLEEKITGRAEIREVFKIGKSKISGCYVTEGKVVRNGKARIVRDGVVIYDGELAGLRRFKDEVKEVAENYECGITFDNYDDVREGDEVEAYEIIEVKRTLEDLKKAAKNTQ